MHAIAKILAGAYIALAVFSAAVFVQSSGNFVSVTEVALAIGDHVTVESAVLDWSGNVTDPAEIRLVVNVTNPGRVAIEVITLDFTVHMEDPDDARDWFDPKALEATMLGTGGMSMRRGQGVRIGPGGTASLEGIVLVSPGTNRMDRLDRPDADGRYHLIVWDPWIAYSYVDFDITSGRVSAPTYYDFVGVLPGG